MQRLAKEQAEGERFWSRDELLRNFLCLMLRYRQYSTACGDNTYAAILTV